MEFESLAKPTRQRREWLQLIATTNLCPFGVRTMSGRDGTRPPG
jgi:hypothetical protein